MVGAVVGFLLKVVAGAVVVVWLIVEMVAVGFVGREVVTLGQGLLVTVHWIVSEAGPVHSLPPLLASEVLLLVLVRVPVPLHVAEQEPLIQAPQTQSTEE